MKLPRDLSGEKLVQVLCRDWEYEKLHQVDSHNVWQTKSPGPHRVPLLNHKVLRVGTLNSILRAVADHKGVSREAIVKGL